MRPRPSGRKPKKRGKRMTRICRRPARAAGGLFAFSRCAGFLALLAFAGAARAYQPPPPDESQLQEHGHYVNRAGHDVHSPAHSRTGAVPAGATARCGDGTYSFSRHHSGTCSHHRGVAEWE